MTTVEVLKAARALIDTPEKWTQAGTYGHDGCFCMDGAIHAAVHGCRPDGCPRLTAQSADELSLRVVAQKALGRVIGTDDVSEIFDFNDDEETTHADVLAAFDRAIAAEGIA